MPRARHVRRPAVAAAAHHAPAPRLLLRCNARAHLRQLLSPDTCLVRAFDFRLLRWGVWRLGGGGQWGTGGGPCSAGGGRLWGTGHGLGGLSREGRRRVHRALEGLGRGGGRRGRAPARGHRGLRGGGLWTAGGNGVRQGGRARPLAGLRCVLAGPRGCLRGPVAAAAAVNRRVGHGPDRLRDGHRVGLWPRALQVRQPPRRLRVLFRGVWGRVLHWRSHLFTSDHCVLRLL
mmetsp:Transcript_70227/g.117194  ORF Transcript_70227/g.117194 Transcript_70227/m.117194 type:complete len:232 (-) Transcript_70227:1646-2341(-)